MEEALITPRTPLDAICPRHGGLTHIALHEAAHAVAAVGLGVRFTTIELFSPRSWDLTAERGMGGVVRVMPSPDWMPERPREGLEFALSGSVAEDLVLGHALDDSHSGDLDHWRVGVGLIEGIPIDEVAAEIERLTGEPFVDTIERTRSWVRENLSRITRVMAALTGLEGAQPGEAFRIVVDEDRVLTEAQVIEVLG